MVETEVMDPCSVAEDTEAVEERMVETEEIPQTEMEMTV